MSLLGIKLKPEDNARLTRHAHDLKQPKSVMARDWILERLERESIDQQMRRAAQILAMNDREEDYTESDLDD